MSLVPIRWKPGPKRPRVCEHDVHVWRSSLDLSGAERSELAQSLSRQEQERAERFATDKLRHRYVVGRGILRSLLGSYLGRPPGDLRIRYGEHEKPYLSGDTDEAILQFNVSHSGDLALFAFSREREIGVDLERIRSDLGQTEIASRFFSASESARLLDLPQEQQSDYFFALWTCKEAFVKARGGGISFGLARFDVQLEPGADSAVIVSNEEAKGFAPWFAYRFDPGPGYAGALAVGERSPKISLWEWQSA